MRESAAPAAVGRELLERREQQPRPITRVLSAAGVVPAADVATPLARGARERGGAFGALQQTAAAGPTMAKILALQAAAAETVSVHLAEAVADLGDPPRGYAGGGGSPSVAEGPAAPGQVWMPYAS
jgi:hypothetical protein